METQTYLANRIDLIEKCIGESLAIICADPAITTETAAKMRDCLLAWNKAIETLQTVVESDVTHQIKH